MLAELAVYLASPAPRAAHRSGAVRDAVALWARGRRCARAWAEHEARSRAAFETAIAAVGGGDTAVVLGSGLVRDVPMASLCARFRKVVLVDLVHLAPVRLAVLGRRWRQVEFLTRDISGYDDLVQRSRIAAATGQDDIGGRLDPLAFVRRMEGVDLVLSANVLSQIGVGAERRLSGRDGYVRLLPEDAVARLIAAHLESLAGLSCRTCLVTDVAYEIRDREDALIEGVDLLHGVEAPDADDRWSWPVVPFGEEDRDWQRVHEVIAVQDVVIDLV